MFELRRVALARRSPEHADPVERCWIGRRIGRWLVQALGAR